MRSTMQAAWITVSHYGEEAMHPALTMDMDIVARANGSPIIFPTLNRGRGLVSCLPLPSILRREGECGGP